MDTAFDAHLLGCLAARSSINEPLFCLEGNSQSFGRVLTEVNPQM
jgi:hypothetical protein